MDNKVIFVKDFSITPGSRYINEGLYSGEQFRNEVLSEDFHNLPTNGKLIVNLDGTLGYGTSWLEEVFGGLARKFGTSDVLNKLDFISEEEPYLIGDIKKYIQDAERK